MLALFALQWPWSVPGAIVISADRVLEVPEETRVFAVTAEVRVLNPGDST